MMCSNGQLRTCEFSNVTPLKSKALQARGLQTFEVRFYILKVRFPVAFSVSVAKPKFIWCVWDKVIHLSFPPITGQLSQEDPPHFLASPLG